MSRTLTALFDTRSDAEAARERLRTAGVDADDVNIHDQSSEGYRASGGYSTSRHHDRGLWSSVKHAFLPDEDRHHYEEAVRRGGVVLSADVDEGQMDDAVRALEQGEPVDLSRRAAEWRSGGWDYPNENVVTAGAAASTAAQADHSSDRAGLENTLARRIGEERIPIVEEQLVVGKREVERGGVRVRTYVTEVPVHEQIRLRDESIHVERRPVDRRLDRADEAFRDRTVEMTEIDEEAVVAKQARVVEEVVIRKSADERVEDIDDTVRRTEVEVERDGSDRSGSSGNPTNRDRF